MVQGELPTIDTGGEISSPNVPSGTGGTKSKSKTKLIVTRPPLPPLVGDLSPSVPNERVSYDVYFTCPVL